MNPEAINSSKTPFSELMGIGDNGLLVHWLKGSNERVVGDNGLFPIDICSKCLYRKWSFSGWIHGGDGRQEHTVCFVIAVL